eukprot:augustus_masked-scaffold_20-processed-gene-5.26-mRNA-1 protein AED:1.00 eAED:1.00 QI:0/0/0/0/1/1/2/0/530
MQQYAGSQRSGDSQPSQRQVPNQGQQPMGFFGGVPPPYQSQQYAMSMSPQPKEKKSCCTESRLTKLCGCLLVFGVIIGVFFPRDPDFEADVDNLEVAGANLNDGLLLEIPLDFFNVNFASLDINDFAADVDFGDFAVGVNLDEPVEMGARQEGEGLAIIDVPLDDAFGAIFPFIEACVAQTPINGLLTGEAAATYLGFDADGQEIDPAEFDLDCPFELGDLLGGFIPFNFDFLDALSVTEGWFESRSTTGTVASGIADVFGFFADNFDERKLEEYRARRQLKPKHVAKYKEIYNQLNYHTMIYTLPSDAIVKPWYVKGVLSKEVVSLISSRCQELNTEEVILHSLSNNGILTYKAMMKQLKIEKTPPFTVKGVIFDSAPGEFSLLSFFGAIWASNPPLPAKFGAATFGMLAIILYLKILVGNPVLVSSLTAVGFGLQICIQKVIQQKHEEELFSEFNVSMPQLYLYSREDKLIRYTTVERAVELVAKKQIQLFNETRVKKVDFIDSPHVCHYLKYKEKYSIEVRNFVESL